jgi:arylsulfatase A-like enzyme
MAKRPNILVLTGDDVGWWNISYKQPGSDGIPDAEHRPRGQ